MEFKKYVRTNIAEMHKIVDVDTVPDNVSISEADLKNGSPKEGDFIARNPLDHTDMWLVAHKYANENFKLADE